MLGNEDVRDLREGVPGRRCDARSPRSCGYVDDDDLGLADDDRVAERRERQRVREGEGTACEDERVTLVALGSKRRDPCGLEHAEEAGDPASRRRARGDDRVLVEPAPRLVADRSRLEREIALGVVVEHHALGREPRRFVDRAVDALVAERAHRSGVRRRIEERDGDRRLLVEAADLVGQALPDVLARTSHRLLLRERAAQRKRIRALSTSTHTVRPRRDLLDSERLRACPVHPRKPQL